VEREEGLPRHRSILRGGETGKPAKDRSVETIASMPAKLRSADRNRELFATFRIFGMQSVVAGGPAFLIEIAATS